VVAVPVVAALLLVFPARARAAAPFWDALRTAAAAADSPFVRVQGVDAWHDSHPALQLPVPGTLTVPVTVPAHARLRTAITLRDTFFGQTLVDVTAPTRFVVTLTPAGGEPQVLLDRVLDPRGHEGDRRWVGAGLDCSRFAGREATITFHVETAGAPETPGRTFAAFARPNLYDPTFQRTQPNLLLISIDALRADHLSCYGYARPTSPHLDRLAAEGLRFAHAFTNAPMTVPSLPQLFTSAYFPTETHATLLTSLFAAGVPATHAIVRNPYLQYFLSLDARDGFDRTVDVDLWRADKLTRAGLKWIDHQRGERWALYLHYLDTHTPYRIPSPDSLAYVAPDYTGPIGTTFGDAEGAAQGIYDASDRRRVADLYDGAVHWTDAQIGTLIDGLRARGLLDHTLVVVTADHGEELWDHGGFFHGGSLYDELLHVPLIMRLPEAAHAGTVVAPQMRTVDIVPTITEVLGTPPVPGADGRSGLELIRAPDAAPSRPVFARAANPQYPWRFGLRTTKHKLVVTVDPPAEQLFDLVADPAERQNRIDDPALAPVLAELRAGLDTFLRPLTTSGFQLRAVAPPGMSSVLEVRVTTAGGQQPLANPGRIGGLRNDRIEIDRDGKTLVWRARVPDTPIGIRFDRGVLPTERGQVKLDVQVRALGVMDIAPRAIFLGPGGEHPPSSPFTFEVKPPAAFGKPPVEDPRLTGAAPARLDAFVGEPSTLYFWRFPPAAAVVPGEATTGGLDEERRQKLRALGYAE
jgi:arylsulfatase